MSEQILGFDEQIGAPKFLQTKRQKEKAKKAKQQEAIVNARIAKGRQIALERQQNIAKMMFKAKNQTKATPGTKKPGSGSLFTALRQATNKPTQGPMVAPARPVTRVAPARPGTRVAPARPGTRVAPALRKLMPKQAVIKPSGQVIPVTKLTRTTRPAAVKAANPIQRSFMPVDLPYQTAKPANKPLKLNSTPFALPVNANMIEPPVDAGMKNYYGK